MTARLLCQRSQSTETMLIVWWKHHVSHMNRRAHPTLRWWHSPPSASYIVSYLRLICPETALTSQSHGVMVSPSLLRQLSRDVQHIHTGIHGMREWLGWEAARKKGEGSWVKEQGFQHQNTLWASFFCCGLISWFILDTFVIVIKISNAVFQKILVYLPFYHGLNEDKPDTNHSQCSWGTSVLHGFSYASRLWVVHLCVHVWA